MYLTVNEDPVSLKVGLSKGSRPAREAALHQCRDRWSQDQDNGGEGRKYNMASQLELHSFSCDMPTADSTPLSYSGKMAHLLSLVRITHMV